LKLTKARILLLLSLLEIAAWVFSGQNWYQVSMTPNDQTVVLQSFDAFTVNGFTSPMLTVTLAALTAALLTNGKSRSLIFSLASATSLGLAVLAGFFVWQQNLSGVAKQIESATGIAATHGLTGVQTMTQIAAPIGVGSYFLLAIGFGIAVNASRFWVKKPSESLAKASTKRPTDAISLWDQQR
jgi:hypothetical protein